jgi:hypothetical protein
MGTQFTVDLSQDTPETIDRGREVEPDWYAVIVHDVGEDPKNGAVLFEFKVVAGMETQGKYAGSIIFDRLYDPDLADTEQKREMAIRRQKLYASRLGLLATDAFGREASGDWMDAMGKSVVVRVERRSYTDSLGEKKEITGVRFDGIYPPDHEKIPDSVRKSLHLPPAKLSAETLARQARAAEQKQKPLLPGTSPEAPSRPPIDVSDL